MATSVMECDNCVVTENDANFAVICSFFFKFGTSLGVTFNIQELKDMIEDPTKVNDELIDLHIKLLRKRRKYINKDRWERALVKFCSEYSNVDAWELERYGYKNSKTSIKLEILKRLLEAQFDYNAKFKLEVNANEAASLRILPIGRDVNGHMYWYQSDSDHNFRIYREELDDDQSWKLLCRSKDQLEGLIGDLESNNSVESKEESLSLSDTNDDSNITKLSVHVKEEVKHDDDNESSSESTQKNGNKLIIDNEKCNIKSDINDINDESKSIIPVIESDVKIDIKIDIKIENEISDSKSYDDNKCIIKSEETHELSEHMIDHCPEVQSPKSVNLNKHEEHEDHHEEHKDHEDHHEDHKDHKDLKDHDHHEDHEEKHQIDNDIILLVNELLETVSTPVRGSKNVQSFSDDSRITLSIEQSVSIVCDYLVDEVCRIEENEQQCKQSTDSTFTGIVSALRSRGSRGRPRGRGRVRGRGRTRVNTPIVKQKEYISRERSPVMMPVKRVSRRIQEMNEKKMVQLKEQMKQEQVQLEQLMKKKVDLAKERDITLTNGTVNKRKKKQNKGCLETSSDDEESDSSSSDDDNKRKKKRQRGKGRKFGANPWDVTESSSEASSNNESEEHEEEDDEELKFDDNEDEFACEELDPDAEPVVIRRARTVKKLRSDSEDSEEESSSDMEVENDDKPCGKCGKYDHPEWILLCDICDDGFHTACLRPPLMLIPDGDWFCPPCEHKMLCKKLHEQLTELSALLLKKEREEMRKQRLKFVAISVDNILKKPKSERKKSTDDVTEKNNIKESNGVESIHSKSEDDDEDERSDSEDEEEDDDDERSRDSWENDYRKPRSHRNRKTINYQFTEFDDLINSAIQEEIEEEKGAGTGKGKDMSNIINAEMEMEITEQIPNVEIADKKIENCEENDKENIEDSENNEEINFKSKSERQKRLQRKRHRGLNDLDSPSEEDDSDEDFKGSSSATELDLSDEEFVDDNASTEEEQSDDSNWRSRRRSNKRRNTRLSKNSRSRKKGGRSGYRRDEFVVTSDDSDAYVAGHSRTRTRAAARKKISYREDTSDDETEEDWNWKKSNKSKKNYDSESSDSDWGGRKKKLNLQKKTRKTWGASDDDDDEDAEDEEDEDEDDDDDENDADDKPSVVTKNVKSDKSRKIEMKGKPRLSKARIFSLKEDSEDDSEGKKAFNKKSNKILESDDEEDDDAEDEEQEEDDSEDNDNDENENVKEKGKGKGKPIVKDNKKSKKGRIVSDDNENDTIDKDQNQVSKDDVHSNIIPEKCADPSLISNQKPFMENLEIASQSLPNAPFSHSESPLLSETPIIETNLNNRTVVSEISSLQTAPNMIKNSSIPYDTYQQSDPLLSKHQTADTLKGSNDTEMYNLTPMEPYGVRPTPLKPTNIGESYPHTLSPPRLLTLESNSYSNQARRLTLEPYNSKPPFDPKLVREPFMNPPRMPAPFGCPPNLRSDPNARPVHHPPPHNYPPHSGLPPPPPYYHPHQPPYLRSPNSFGQERFLPPTQSPSLPQHSSIRNVRPPSSTTQPSASYRPPSDPIYQSPQSANYFPPHQSNYYPPQTQQHPNVHLSPNYSAPYTQTPQQYPYYTHSTGPSPNGGFMIHNLLQHNRGTSEENTSAQIGEDEMRNINEFPPFMTQE